MSPLRLTQLCQRIRRNCKLDLDKFNMYFRNFKQLQTNSINKPFFRIFMLVYSPLMCGFFALKMGFSGSPISVHSIIWTFAVVFLFPYFLTFIFGSGLSFFYFPGNGEKKFGDEPVNPELF